MAPLIALVISFVVFWALGLLLPYFHNPQFALRAALGVMFILTATAQWDRRRPDLVRMVPDRLGNAGIWVSLTGAAEFALAAGLQVPHLAFWTAMTAVIMLFCLLPANIKAARERLTILRKPVLPLGPRVVLPLVFIAALLISVLPLRAHPGAH